MYNALQSILISLNNMTTNKFYLFILISLLLGSCQKQDNDYDIINNFMITNNIEVKNLQANAFCFKDLYLTNGEAKILNIDLKNDKCYQNNKIDLKKINFHRVEKNQMDSKISFPLFSKDGKFAYIVIQNYEANSKNFYKKEVIYKIAKDKGKWKIIDTYEFITQS